MRRRTMDPLRSASAVLALFLLVACAESTRPPPAELVGTFTLTRVDDRALPAPFVRSGTTEVTAVGGSLVVDSEGEFTKELRTRVVAGDSVSTGKRVGKGTVRVTGSSLEFRERLGPTYTGTLRDGEVRIDFPVGDRTVPLTFLRR